jgi:hypothetical protein
MLKKIGLIGIMGLTIISLVACGPELTAVPMGGDPSETNTLVASSPALTSDELKQFNEYIPSIRGASLIKIAEIRNQNEAHIQYKKIFPVVDTVNKALMEESIRLLREFPAITRITMKIPCSTQIYAIDTRKRSIENYMKISFKKIHDELNQKQWKELTKKYFTAKERDKFAKRFIRTS